jgi:2-methylcitrate dehydratase
MDETKKEDSVSPRALGRRDMMKMGVGAGIAVTQLLKAPAAFAQGQGQTTPPPTGGLEPASHGYVQTWPDIRESNEVASSSAPGYITKTGPGWRNTSGRASGNGPMDESTRRIVEFVHKYSEKDLTDSAVEATNAVIIDMLGSMMGGGFESEPARVIARMAQKRPGECTVFGYGISTTPEMAAFANGSMIRWSDFNTAPHNNEMFGGVLAVAEMVHATGPQVLAAMVIAYEVVNAIGNTGLGSYGPAGFDTPYHGTATAMAAGKLLGFNEDQLANALSLALVPHMPLYVCHIGTQSMWKGCHSSQGIHDGVWAAMLAREGMTGPCTPFEGRDGLLAHIGPFTRELRLPTSGTNEMAIETIHGKGGGFKRYASEGNTQAFWNDIAAPLHAWAKPEEIESIDFLHTYFGWQEISDPPKWDPLNRETADHSMPYNIAHGVIDGEVFVDSFTEEKRKDPRVRMLMDRITIHPDRNLTADQEVLTARKKSGEEKVFKTGLIKPMTHDDLVAKYNRLADWGNVNKEQKDRALAQWTNLRTEKDIAAPIKTIAKFGQAKPLSDMSPARIS